MAKRVFFERQGTKSTPRERSVRYCTKMSEPSRHPVDDPSVVMLERICQDFGDVRAVSNVSLVIREGEIVALLGPNGAGKTSTLDIVLGLAAPSAGVVSILGTTPRQAIQRGFVAAVLQTGGLLKDLTVRETLRYVASLYDTALSVDELLERVGLVSLSDRVVAKCSGGEQQRLRFAMSLVSDPKLLILDEPTQGMDVEARRDFWRTIRNDGAAKRTVIFATHYLEEADAYADRVILMRQGEIVADGTALEIQNLVAGRRLRATWPRADLNAVRAIGGVTSVEQRGDTILITSTASDEVARFLLTHTPAQDLEVTGRGIEDAFLAITGTTNDSTTAP